MTNDSLTSESNMTNPSDCPDCNGTTTLPLQSRGAIEWPLY